MKEIKKSLEDIAPREGAKERMLEKIYDKAETVAAVRRDASASTSGGKAAPQKGRRLMRLVLPLAACLCLAVFGLSNLLSDGEPRPQPLPTDELTVCAYAKVSGVQDFSALNAAVAAPEGAQTAEYAILNGDVASVEFELNGHTYYFRATADDADISGLQGDEETDCTPDGADYTVVRLRIGRWFCLKQRWKKDGVVYYLSNTDGATIDELEAVFLLLHNGKTQ